MFWLTCSHTHRYLFPNLGNLWKIETFFLENWGIFINLLGIEIPKIRRCSKLLKIRKLFLVFLDFQRTFPNKGPAESDTSDFGLEFLVLKALKCNTQLPLTGLWFAQHHIYFQLKRWKHIYLLQESAITTWIQLAPNSFSFPADDEKEGFRYFFSASTLCLLPLLCNIKIYFNYL